MMYAVTPETMRRQEADFMAETGMPALLLMEHAALGLIKSLSGHVLFLCGFGQNGGDGYAAARLYRGKATCWQFHKERLSGPAKTNAAMLRNATVYTIENELPPIPEDVEWVVDALFGTGLCRPVEGIEAEAIRVVNESGLNILSCDIPSGIHGQTGEAMGAAIRANTTVTFHQPKAGLYLGDGLSHSGRIVVHDIGLPYSKGDYAILEPSDLPLLRPTRLRDSHKGDYGRVLIVAGSMGMAGAAAICAAAAIRAGAGLTTLACDEEIMPILQCLVPSAMCVPISRMAQALQKADAVAIGPGLGCGEERLPVLEQVIQSGKPAVWDADALTLLSKHKEYLPLGERNVFTPHPGEAARFDSPSLQSLLGGTLVLKGATTLITDGKEKALNVAGTPAMAKGGSGDALTGIIAALLAKTPDAPFMAAQLGCLLHGMAGLAAMTETGEHGLDAFALISKIR